MNRAALALYDNVEEAYHVVNELVYYGIPREQIRLLASDPQKSLGQVLKPGEDFPATPPVDLANYDKPYVLDVSAKGETTHKGLRGLVNGVITGGLSGLLLGLGALFVSGEGSVLMAALVGAGIGALIGGVIGGMMQTRIPQEREWRYARSGRQAGALIVVTPDDPKLLEQAVEVMNNHQPVDMARRSADWQTMENPA